MNLNEIRQKYPQYSHVDDKKLADALYNKYYSHVDRAEFDKRIGYKPEPEQSALNKLPRNIAVGLAEAGRGLANFPSQLQKDARNRIISPEEQVLGEKPGTLLYEIPSIPKQDFRKRFGLSGEPTLSDKIISGLVQHLPALIAPEAELGVIGKGLSSVPKIGRYLKTIAGQSAPTAAYEATQSDENPLAGASEAAEATAPFSIASALAKSGKPALSIGGRLGLSALGGYLGHHASQALGAGTTGDVLSTLLGASLGRVGLNPSNEARRSMLQGVEGTPYKEKLGAAERLGLSYLTPAEASGNPFVGAQQGAIGKTEGGAKLLYEKGQQRLESERKAISNMLDETYKAEKLDPERKALYASAYEKSVPEEEMASLQDNEIFKRAKRIVENRPAYKESLKNIPENSIAYLDHIKQAMDDMIEKAPLKEAGILEKTKKDLVNKMDIIAPEYEQARSLAERQILRRTLEKEFNKKDMRGTNFLKLLNDKKKFDEVNHHLRNAPQAQQQLADMKLIFGDLINPPTVRTAAGLAKTSMTKERSDTQALKNILMEQLTGGKYDKAAVELITNPKWADELHKLSELSKGEKRASKLADLLGRANAARTTESRKAK